jgi:hypothetical protein
MSFRQFLESTGLVLAPAGLVAVLCQLADVTPKLTVVASAFAVLIAALYLMRPLIDARVPATYLAILCAVVAGIFALHLARTDKAVTKPTSIYPQSSQFQNDIGTYFESTQSEIWILAINVHAHLPSKMDQVVSRLKAGVKVKYLILDPYSPKLPLIAEGLGASTKDLQAQCLFSTYSLLRLSREWANVRKTAPRQGELEIRFYDDIPRARLYAFDPNAATGATVLVPYINRHSSMTLPAMVFSNSNRDVINAYLVSFERLWETAIPLDTALQMHPELNSP